ncbi:MAG: NAD(+) diphosphatase [Rhodospirillaceae bacterium]|nr:NAD(+) diphosphatase [Rhodospirillaceae bacterium]MBT3491924.1 NAD(+) diphosphatase [Rhodospirillaceae bacterium]MBT3780228.1 NAD(+) diphosphatase [Rhodospirillaceae bacterium]MBT3978016.1 NAD(+) diphosphatase [Rhodospirillaceae bacterium]MBT4166621.1 NAD(+) diphosphatase [Rhodospirillaceae bacterium]
MTNSMRYADGDFDRAAECREDPEWLAARLAHDSSRVYPIWRHRFLFQEQRVPVALAPAAAGRLAGLEHSVLLGVIDDTAHFTIDVSTLSEDGLATAIAGAAHDLRDVAMNLSDRMAAMLAFGRGMSVWHVDHQFCGRCGGPTKIERAGHARRCLDKGCGRLHFPRTDPAVITLVIDGERCLLARRATIDIPRFSTVAGFVEPGETLEDAVRREVVEEVGVLTGAVMYRASQPWPFPSSLMMGFWARATSSAIKVDGEEIGEAAWFTRADIDRALAADEIILPPEDSISRRLVEDWRNLAEGTIIEGLE